ncbi:MAG: nucleotidyl transferase AbiEii/AbiGii toxin family protein, partial [Dehalococcoidia bacterium]
MSRLERALRGIASELARPGISWALVGGLAVSARAEPRFTRDIDLALAVRDDAMAEALVHGLAGSGYRVLTSIEQEA